MNMLAPSTPPEAFGRYLLYPAIARGGMATVHPARLVGAEGFTRLVAAKRLHPQFTDDPDFVTMFHDEACIASRIHHPNVVPVLDVVVSGHELILVQEYVHGVPLSQLMKNAQVAAQPIAIDVAIAVLTGVLAGLHGAHEVKDEADRPLEIVHRDVSPQNVMISVDGIPRLLDFGIAKARTSTHHTREGVFKGKLAYMAPEQLRMEATERTIDVYATGVLAWELLVNRRIYDGRHEIAFVTAVMTSDIPSITTALEDSREAIGEERWRDIVALEPIVSRAMAPLVEDRFATADEMLHALLDVRGSASSMAVAEWVREAGSDFLDARQRALSANEESWRRTSLYVPTPASGTQPVEVQRVQHVVPPSGTYPSMAGPPMPSSLSGVVAPSDSGAYRVALGVGPLARLRADLRLPRVLPWIAVGLFVLGCVAGGLLSATTERPPQERTSQPALSPPPTALPPPSPPQIAAAPDPTVVVPVVAPLASAPPAPRAAPPPAPHYWPPPRPWTPPPPAAATPPATSTASASKSDCNPPFFFDGTKKVFKPSCL